MCKSITLALLWVNWGIVTALAITYAVVGWMTFSFVKYTSYGNGDQIFSHKITDAIRISLFVSIMAVLLHALTALGSHIREVMTSKENFTYGYVGASSFLTAVIVFVASTQQANADSYFYNLPASNTWSKYKTRIYRASYGVGYVIMAFLLINFGIILLGYMFGTFKVKQGKKGDKAAPQTSGDNNAGATNV